MSLYDRRRVLQGVGAGVGATVLAGCMGGGGNGDQSSQHVIEPEGAATIPVYYYGSDNGAWDEYGMEVTLEVASFGKFTRQLTDDLANIAGFSAMYAIQFMDEGEDPMTTIGQQLNFYNQIMSKEGSGISEVEDLADAHLGVPTETSQTTRVVRAMILDEYDFDILEDPAEVNSSDPPSLWQLLQDDELDAILEFSGFTLAGNASDDIQTVFDSFEFWMDRTGQPPSVADFVVETSWLEENPQIALDYLNGWWDAGDMFQENSGEAISEYGTEAGITDEAEQAVTEEWTNDGILYPLERGYSQEMADSTYELMNLMAEYDLLEGVPDDPGDLFTTTDELEDMT